jgi:thioredoxin-like negative regulator of GroEL
MDKKDIKEFFKTKAFKQNPKARKVFRKSTFGDLMKPENEYKDMVAPTKNKSKNMSKGALRNKTKRGKSRRGKSKLGKRVKKTLRKSKRTLYYFYMDGCGWCDKFNPTWLKLINEFKNKLTMKKVNGPSSPNLLKEFDIQTFPAIVLVTGKDSDKYEGDRSMKDLKKFLR